MKKNKFSVFADKLVKYFTTEIVEKEKLFSKPDPFKYKIDKRDELGNEYASDSSEIESGTDDFISSDEYRTISDITTDSDIMKSEETVSGNEYNNFAFQNSKCTFSVLHPFRVTGVESESALFKTF